MKDEDNDSLDETSDSCVRLIVSISFELYKRFERVKTQKYIMNAFIDRRNDHLVLNSSRVINQEERRGNTCKFDILSI